MAQIKIVNVSRGTITWFVYNGNDQVEIIALPDGSGVLAQGHEAEYAAHGGNNSGFVVNIHYNQEQTKFTLPNSGGTVTYPGG